MADNSHEPWLGDLAEVGPRAEVGYGVGCGVCAPVAVMSFSVASCRRFLFVVASAGGRWSS